MEGGDTPPRIAVYQEEIAQAYLENVIPRITAWERFRLCCQTRGLTPAEVRVANMYVAGQTREDIASRLCVSVNTVKTHLRKAGQKLGARVRQVFSTILTETLEGQSADHRLRHS